MKKRYSEEQIIGAIKQHEAGAKVDDLYREMGISVRFTIGEVSTPGLKLMMPYVSKSYRARTINSKSYWQTSCSRMRPYRKRFAWLPNVSIVF